MNPFDAPPAAPHAGGPTLPAPPPRPTTTPPVEVPRPAPTAPAFDARTMLPGTPPPPVGVGSHPMEQLAGMRAARARRRRTSRVVSVIVVLALLGGGAFAFLRLRGDDSGTPSSWPDELAPLVASVERLRSLEFQHPLRLEYLDNTEFDARLEEFAVAPPSAPEAGTRYRTELLDLFGMVPGARSTVQVDVAWLPASDVIVVRGETITPTIEAALVHELTVAVLAQFAQTPSGTPTVTSSSSLATAAIVQGDADRVADLYVAQLPPATAAAIGTDLLPVPASAGLQAAPWPLLDAMHVPFVLGEELVADAMLPNGVVGVNDRLRTPPDESVVANPWSPWAEKRGDFEAVPIVPPGSLVIESAVDLTAVEMLVAFDTWLPWTTAGDAVLVWLDGTYTTYRATPGGPLCAAVAVMVPTTATTYVVEAFTFWSTAMGAPVAPEVETATVVSNLPGADPGDTADTVRMTLCARDPAAPVAPAPIVPTIDAMLFERSLVPAGVHTFDVALPSLCTAAILIDDPVSAALLMVPTRDAAQEAQLAALTATASGRCTG